MAGRAGRANFLAGGRAALAEEFTVVGFDKDGAQNVRHRLAYAAGILGVVHFIWRVKADLREPVTYAVILAVLLLVPVIDSLRSRLGSPAFKTSTATLRFRGRSRRPPPGR